MKSKILFCVVYFCLLKTLHAQPTQPTNTNTIWGDFKAIKMETFLNNTSQSTFYYGMVKLFPLAVTEREPFRAIQTGDVKFNNKFLKYNMLMKNYTDTIERKTDEGIVWAVSNSTVISNFTNTSTFSYPIFTNISAIPDTIRKSSMYIINITGKSNCDFVEFILDDNQVHGAVPWYRKVNATSNSIAISGSNFSSITVQSAFVRLVFTKKEYKIINNKRFSFENRYMIVKPVVIVN